LAEHLSVEKRARQNEKERKRNRVWKSRLKTVQNRLRRSIESNDGDSAAAQYHEYVSLVDKAVSKGVIHKKTAARKKTRMAQRISSLKPAQ
jgi:small subunit ribosomal protein S20